MSITDGINAACSDATGNRTLAQLRSAVLDALGMKLPTTVTATRSLSNLRDDLAYRLGMGDQLSGLSSGFTGQLNSAINEAQIYLWRRLQIAASPTRMTLDADLTGLDYPPVLDQATAMLKAHDGAPDAKFYREQVEDYVARHPPGLSATIDRFLIDAQVQLYRRYDALRTERFYSWPLTANQHMYVIANYDEQNAPQSCPKGIDPSKVTWVGCEISGDWYPLREGIPPELYTQSSSGRPQRYEIDQAIRLWPKPSTTSGNLVVKGHFGLEAFSADNHTTTINDQLVYLLAVANAKGLYRQPDAQGYVQQMEVLLANIVAGTHLTSRYIPGAQSRGDGVYTLPAPSVPFA